MRIARPITTTLLALLACTAACLAMSCASALADTLATTGGAGPSTPSNTKTKVHPTGIATWFGPGFYGQTTACGQTLTPAVVGVANRTLPCGTLVQVTYRGHSLTVPVLDRGPYANHADWDLTAGAAEALDVTDTVRIGTRVVGSAPNTPTLGSPPVSPAEAATGGAQAG
jgi:rare lipoprotein A (peptidoglycan hydrolase)